MCLVCVELKNEKLTLEEAKKNLGEMVDYPKSQEEKNHFLAVLEEIKVKEQSQKFWEVYYEGAD